MDSVSSIWTWKKIRTSLHKTHNLERRGGRLKPADLPLCLWGMGRLKIQKIRLALIGRDCKARAGIQGHLMLLKDIT